MTARTSDGPNGLDRPNGTRTRTWRAARAGALAAGAAVRLALLAGCGERAAGTVTVRDAWARPAAAGATGAVYLTLVNGTARPVAVVGAASRAARAAELHESMERGSGAAAMVHMHAVPRVEVAAGDSLVLRPGGRHLMLVGLAQPLVPGARVPVALVTAAGDSIRVEAVVRGF